MKEHKGHIYSTFLQETWTASTWSNTLPTRILSRPYSLTKALCWLLFHVCFANTWLQSTTTVKRMTVIAIIAIVCGERWWKSQLVRNGNHIWSSGRRTKNILWKWIYNSSVLMFQVAQLVVTCSTFWFHLRIWRDGEWKSHMKPVLTMSQMYSILRFHVQRLHGTRSETNVNICFRNRFHGSMHTVHTAVDRKMICVCPHATLTYSWLCTDSMHGMSHWTL